ncbi:unnamed protein product [Didymodactylos carnosus]|uniref:CUE domain-containing protein n=1 Tax=Didymodactylos carnosus TaxID=1234261 RepID=A0A8S2WXC9_9BILA|nr:unnamed protein product [Didymodactylos carnosus]
MRDKVAQVRQQISSDFTREQIELALLHYESNVEDTIEAFKKNGAKDALSGWTEMNNRSSTSSRRGGARTRNNNRLVASPTISSSSTSSQISHVPMRPSQLVLNVFNQFANKTQPVTSITNGIEIEIHTNNGK